MEAILTANWTVDHGHTLPVYEQRGGYASLRKAVTMTGDTIVEEVKKSNLRGRGGAGFPTGVKWSFLPRESDVPKYLVVNADEGEPGTFKDRYIMELDPHRLIEGCIITGWALGLAATYIFIRGEMLFGAQRLEAAIAECYDKGYLGRNILGSGFEHHVYVHRGAGAYICGEETALLNSLEGKHPFPRNRPPYPVTHGFEGKPTAVNNVETLAAVPQILRREPSWYQNLGLGDIAGTKIISLSGDVQRPGNYEVPFGLPLQTLLYEWAGGPPAGRAIHAVTMAGLSGGFLAGDALEQATIDEPSIRSHGSMLGAGGMIVFDDSRDMIAVAHNAMSFFAHESCGKCFPCR
ncbi:MAG: NADH-quinone oxidoreductase subunit NuoF, partial [Myxococcales bacterium]|nr:NADH-quinone oxidoreductase subunit NuoF [Myxococcales bacterium]